MTQMPTPRMFGSEEAAQRLNPRPASQMQQGGASGQQFTNLLSGEQQWWTQEPAATSLATTTGQNLQGPENAFDTNFWSSAQEQDEEARNSSDLSARWSRPDATGVVVYDSKRQGLTFGDVYQGGRLVGNIYQGYAGLTNTDADELMARMVLPREVWAQAYEQQAGRPGTWASSLSGEIQAERTRRADAIDKGESAQEFESGVAERAAGFEEQGLAQGLNVGAGAAGGAVTGAGAGALIGSFFFGAGAVPGAAIGAAVGGIAGGIGSWLNRDETFRSVAQAQEQWELATADGHTALGYADALAGFAGAGAEKLNVSRSLLHGGYDAAVGEVGDQVASYYDTEVPLWMMGADTAALLIDGVGSFGSSLSRTVFTGLMGANVAAGQASVGIGVAEGNLAFNPYSGRYEDIGAGGMLQQQASVGIDMAQLGAVGVLGRVIRSRTGATPVASAGGWVISGQGTAAATAVRPGFSMLIPSEAATGLTARMFARRTLRQEGSELTRENLARETARQIELLTTGQSTIATAVVNGFGEGAEEFVQAALGATAFGETPTFRELLEAARQGFGMGFGMGTAVGAGSRSRSDKYLARANTVAAFRGDEQISPEQWRRMTQSEQARLGTVNEAEQELFTQTAQKMVEQASVTAVRSYPELQKAMQVARQLAEQEMRNSQPNVEPSRLQVFSNYEWGAEDYVVSVQAARRDIEARVATLQAAAAGRAVKDGNGGALTLDEAERAQAAQIAASDEVLLAGLRSLESRVAGQDRATVVAELSAFNEELRRWWAMRPGQDEESFTGYGARRSASVWAARFPLNSRGSFQLMRLQLDPDLTMTGANNTALVPEEILAQTGGDFDGDRIVALPRELLPDETYDNARYGVQDLTSEGTMLSAKNTTLEYLPALHDALQRTGGLEFKLASDTATAIRRKLSTFLSQTTIPQDVRDELVDNLVRGLRARKASVVGALLSRLATDHAPAMRVLAESIDGNPYRSIFRLIGDELREFQRNLSLMEVQVDPVSGVELPATSKAQTRWARRPVVATSDFLTGMIESQGKYDVFRFLQVLKYNARREATTTGVDEVMDVLAEQYRTFTARNDGIVRRGEDAVFEGTIVQERVVSWLEGLAAEVLRDPASLNELGVRTQREAMVLLAGASVRDVDAMRRRARSEGDVLVVQAMLHQVVEGVRGEYAEIIGDEQVAARLASLDAITAPNYMDEGNTYAQGGEAFTEVLGAYPITELIGDQGAAINSYTVRGLRDELIGLRWDAREAFERALKAHPSWPETDGVRTPYRVLVENVIESARMQLSEERPTDKHPGRPRGTLTIASATASRNFRTMHDAIRATMRLRNVQPNTAADVRAFLNTDLRLLRAVHDMMEARGIRAATVQRNEAGEVTAVQFPQWMYAVLAEKRSTVAEKMLLRNTLILAKAGISDELGPDEAIDVASVGDRILRLWLDLDYRAHDTTDPGQFQAQEARNDFLRHLAADESVESFIEALNSDFRFRDPRSAPFIAWSRDRSLVEADRFGQGVSAVQEGTEMREALRDAAAVATTVLRDEQALATYKEDNAELLAQLRRAKDKGDSQGLWRRFTEWFEVTKDLPVLVGASVWLKQASEINKIVGGLAVKGVTADNVMPLGAAITAQLPTFDAAWGRIASSLTSSSMGSVLTDMTQLARSDRTIVLNDGTVVDWQQMTPERALDLLEDPVTAGLASRMLGLTAWDYNADLDRNLLVSLVGKGVAGFTADTESSLLGSAPDAKLRRLMTLEGMATSPGGMPIIPLILAVQMNVREAALDHPIRNDAEREAMGMSILTDIADAFDALSRVDGAFVNTVDGLTTRFTPQVDEVTGEESTVLNQILLGAVRKARRESPVDNGIAALLPESGVGRDIAHNVLQRWIAKFSQSAVASGNKVLMQLAQQMTKDLNTADEITSPLDVLLDTYSDYMDVNVQLLLLEGAKEWGDLPTAAPWAATAIQRARNPRTPQVVVRSPLDPQAQVSLPDLTTQQWQLIASATIAYSMHSRYGIASRVETALPVFPDPAKPEAVDAQRAFWDPTFVEPALDIFAPGLLRNPMAGPAPLLMQQLNLMHRLGQGLPATTVQQAQDAVYKLMAPQVTTDGRTTGVTGRWHALLPALMHYAVGAAVSSAAPSGIAMAGLTPGRLAVMTATTQQDWTRRPSDDELSTTSIPADQLHTAIQQGEELDSQIDIQISGRPEQVTRSLIQLEGRVARGITLTLPDGRTVELLGHRRYSSGLLLPSSAGAGAADAAVITLPTLQAAVAGVLRDENVAPGDWGDARVDVSFFHPDTKSVSALRTPGANYDHNPWFDGVASRTDSAFAQRSLIGTMLFDLDGLVPGAYETALSATKKLTFALQQTTTMPESVRRAQTTRGLVDMSGMLDFLTVFALKQQIDGEQMKPHLYNGMRKLLSLLYVVRYIDENGEPQVISSEEMIARQMAGETFGPDARAEVVGLPLQHVLALMGEHNSEELSVEPWGERQFSPDVSRLPQYTSFPAQAWTDQMLPGLTRVREDDQGNVLGWDTRNLLEEAEFTNMPLPRVQVVPTSQQTKSSRRDFYGPMREHQTIVMGARRQVPHAQTIWAEQKARVAARAYSNERNIGKRVMTSVQLQAEGRLTEAAAVATPRTPVVTPSNDFSTAWELIPGGRAVGGVSDGVLTEASEISSNVTIGDDVYMDVGSLTPRTGVVSADDQFEQGREFLAAAAAVGATIILPAGPGERGVRTRLVRYLREHDYMTDGSATTERFIPRPAAVRTQAEAASASTLTAATPRTSHNRVLVEYSIDANVDENSAYSVNGGLGEHETYDVREVVQTGRFAGYIPLVTSVSTSGTESRDMRKHAISTLLKVVESEAGMAYLVKQSAPEALDTEAQADFNRAIELFHARLKEALVNPRHPLVPTAGDEFGTGDIIPLVSYNEFGEILGLHLHRHGHSPVSEELLRGDAMPEGNVALGVDGIRLTIDRASVDATHTTHRGLMVEQPKWLGLQGMVVRVRTELSEYGAKAFETGTGFKITTAPGPSTLVVPSTVILAGQPVKLVADDASPRSKNAEASRLDTVSRIVEAVGFDVMPYLVRLLRNVEFSDSDESYATARFEVLQMLQQFRNEYGGSITPEQLLLRRTDELALTIRAQARALVAARFEEYDDQDLTSSPQREADTQMLSLVLESLAAGGNVDEVLGAPGYVGATSGTASHTMHPVFTSLLQQAAPSSPVRQAFVEQINARMPYDPMTGWYELTPEFTWVRHVRLADGTHQAVPTMLAFPALRATDTNDALTEMGTARRQRGDISATTLAMMFTTAAAVPMLDKRLNRGATVFSENQNLHGGPQGARKLVFGSQSDKRPEVVRATDDMSLLPAELEYIHNTALPAAAGIKAPITEPWMAKLSRSSEFVAARRELRLTDRDNLVMHELIRAVQARPATAEGTEEYLSEREARAAVKLILRNVRRGDWPTHEGAVNLVSEKTLRKLFDAGYPLRAGNGKMRSEAKWDQWVDVMLSEVFSADTRLRGYPAVSSIVDGLLYEYRKHTQGVPVTTDNQLSGMLNLVRQSSQSDAIASVREEILSKVATRSGLLVSSPRLRRRFDAPSTQRGRRINDPADFEVSPQELGELPQDARAIIEARMTRWEADRGLKRKRQSPRREAIRGAQVRADMGKTNMLLRFGQLGYVLKSLLNPGLWVGAFVELGIKGAQERMVSFLSGESLGAQGFTAAQRQQWKDTVAALTESTEFYSMVYANTRFNQFETDTRLEKRLQRFTNMATAVVNDPTWGTSSKMLASTFMEAAWSTLQLQQDKDVTVETFLDTLAANPSALTEISADAVAHGYSRIEYRRNLQDNLAEITRRHVVEGIVNSQFPAASTLGTVLLRWPTLFFRFRTNTLINLMGLQAPHAILTTLLSDRTRRPGGIKSVITGRDDGVEEEVSDTARIEDSYDLTRAIIRSGVSHTQLMMLGMLISSAGFGGEDDEEQLLNKLRRYQDVPVAKDPLSLANDFRNAEAWFADFLPAGMGVPSWILRPFVSPAMGVARFHETGDPRQILWGFQDALGSLPLLNADTVYNSWNLANEMIAAAETEAQDDSDEATANATRLLLTAMGTLEAMLFESAFASMIYQAADEWDRDPYAIPLLDSEGNIQRYANGVPRATDMLDDFIDPVTGERRFGYASRNEMDARLHALAENRPVFAHVMSLIMQDSSFIRYNMPPKIREVESQPLTQEEAEQIVVSILNNETGREELTVEGAEAVVRGVHLGTVTMDSPALAGIFIPTEMRFEIQERMLADLTEKYLVLGYSKSEALSHAKEEWYGQAYGEPEALGLADIVWSNRIPEYQVQEYMQLNTTYVMGPNGRPIATGLQRSVLAAIGLSTNLFGFESYHDGTSSNLEVDQLLNSVDSGRGVNLGQRGLVKIDESWVTPTAEEIGESIEEALGKISDQLDELMDEQGGGWQNYGGRGWRNFGRRGGGGGGYGGYSSRADYGGQVYRLNTPRGFRTPYALDPRTVNTSNPYVRRATIRRERFSSQRGRLNQWQ